MIRKATTDDLSVLTELACVLWPGHAVAELQAELLRIMTQPEAVFYLAMEDEGAVGFAQCQLRHDYVEGTDTSPVGYLEGIYVMEGYRDRGIASALLLACESWAKSNGCVEFASDCQLDNVQSLRFHLKVGFEEAGRIICFTKQL